MLLAVEEIDDHNDYHSYEIFLRKKLWNMFIRLCYWIEIIFDVYWCTDLLTL